MAWTGWPGVSILWLGEIESLICSFCLSVAAHTIVCADLSLDAQACCWDVKQPTNNRLGNVQTHVSVFVMAKRMRRFVLKQHAWNIMWGQLSNRQNNGNFSAKACVQNSLTLIILATVFWEYLVYQLSKKQAHFFLLLLLLLFLLVLQSVLCQVFLPFI